MSLTAKKWLHKGNKLLNTSEYDKAITCYEKALEAYPYYAEAWFNKGSALVALECRAFDKPERCYEALTCFDEALKINPEDDDVWNYKGVVFRMLRNSPEAVACFDKAIEKNPKNINAWSNKADLLARDMRKLKESLECFDKAIAISPQNERCWVHKGDIFMEHGKYWHAITCYNRALEIAPDETFALHQKNTAIQSLIGREKASGEGMKQ